MALSSLEEELRSAKRGTLWRDLVIVVLGLVLTLLLVRMGAEDVGDDDVAEVETVSGAGKVMPSALEGRTFVLIRQSG